MTKLLLLLLGIAFFNCTNKPKDQNSLDLEFSYSVDTMRIDPDDHLFYLAHGLQKIKLSPEERYLYFYDDFNITLEKVDLLNNKYLGSIQLDNEGPKGIGSGFDYAINLDGTLLIFTTKRLLLIDQQGVLISSHPVSDSSFDIGNQKQFFRYASISSDQRYFFGLTSSIGEDQYLGWINLKDSTYREVKPDSMSYTENLKIDLGRISITSGKQAKYLANKVLLFHNDGIDIYVLTPELGSWEFYDNDPRLIEKRKPGNFPKSGEIADVTKILEQKNLEVYYQPMVYDSKSKRYYRVASKKKEHQARGTVSDQYLLIFSEDFDLIHEENFSDFPIALESYFIRDGKFWIRNNDTEELEFFVFDFIISES